MNLLTTAPQSIDHGIVIIGSGFAARQLVKSIRKQNNTVPLTLIAADSMDEYNKPDLSHVISLNQHADDLTRQTAEEFSQQYNLQLFPHTIVTNIDALAHTVSSHDKKWHYSKLVLATGAAAFIPPISGNELMLTLNSQQEYRAHEKQLHNAQRVMIVGGGLIGTELAMDFCRAGKTVTLIDNTPSILSSLMPPELTAKLQHCLTDMGIHLSLKTQLKSLQQTDSGIQATFENYHQTEIDSVIAATGLQPQTTLAQLAELKLNRGIIVNDTLQTSDKDIYALGDCAEINGQIQPFLQPILLSASCLANNLLGNNVPLKLPPMLVRIKTPAMPLHLAGETQRTDLNWSINSEKEGMIAKGYDVNNELRAFMVSENKTKDAVSLLRLLAN